MKILLFFIVLAVYISAGPPALTVGDSGEFITSSYTLGVSHPPGYPLYSILGKVFSMAPVSNIARRVAFGSVLFSALTPLLIFLIIMKVTKNRVASFLSALVYSFTGLVWSQSIIAEVYSLNAFFTALCVLILLLWQEKNEEKYLYLFGFVFGISLANHYPMMMLSSIGFLAFLVFHIKGINAKGALVSLFFLVIGLSLYVYLPVRSGKNPPVDWGNPETFASFVTHVFRQQYKSLEMGASVSLADKAGFLKSCLKDIVLNFNVFLIAAAAGILICFRKMKNMFWTTALVFLANTVLLIYLLEFRYNPERLSIMRVYYIPAYIMLALWTGMGLKYFLDNVRAHKRVLIAFIAFLLIQSAVRGSRENFQRNNFIAYDYGRNILSFLKKDSVLFIQKAGDESLFTTLYLKYCAGKRGDLSVYDCWGNVFENIYGEGFNVIGDRNRWFAVRRNVEGKIIYTSGRQAYYATFARSEDALDVPMKREGLVYKVKPRDVNKDIWQLYSFRGADIGAKLEYQEKEILGVYRFFQSEDYFNSGDEKKGILALKTAAYLSSGVNWIVNNAGLSYYRKGYYTLAEKTFLDLLKDYPLDLAANFNLGLVYKQKGMKEKAADYFARSARIAPQDAESHKELADLYWQSGDKKKAGDIFRTVLKGNKDISAEYVTAGSVFYNEGKIEDAVEEWQKALMIDDKNKAAYYNMGIVLLESGRRKDAKMYFEKFLSLSQDARLNDLVKKQIEKLK